MTRGKIFEPINDTPENIAKALFRNDRIRKQKMKENAKTTDQKKVKAVVDNGDTND